MIEKISSTKLSTESIVVLGRCRQPTEQQVNTLRKSLRENGLLSPIRAVPVLIESERGFLWGRVCDSRCWLGWRPALDDSSPFD